MKPRVGVSVCLLGERVRYDGGHKRQPWTAELSERFEWVRVCPEVELGLGTPRETIQLETAGEDVVLFTASTRRDLTAAMRGWARERAEELAAQGLDGYVFKARSPSCGLGTAAVAGSDRRRDGLFAEAVRESLPLLPCVDEEALAAPDGRARFERLVRAHLSLRLLFRPGWTRGEVVDFHTKRKLLLLAWAPAAYAELGALVGRMDDADPRSVQAAYAESFLGALGEEPSPGRHANALAHAAGYFSEALPAAERAELAAAIQALGAGRGELEPLKARIAAYAAQFGEQYLLDQVYLRP